MPDIILYQPEIPPNTGNIIRLCANSGTRLHLIEPLGFVLDNARLRRAGLDYDELTDVHRHLNWQAFRERNPTTRLWGFSTKGAIRHSDAAFGESDGLVFGPETRGLPREILSEIGEDHVLRLPMQENSRSINLSNTVAIGLYEALRQLDFAGLR